MVHLEDAAVALRAVVASIGLGLVTPLADADTAKTLLFDADNDFIAFVS